jgi:hypothetical protein
MIIRFARLLAGVALVASLSAPASAQSSKSGALAKELTQMLKEQSLDSIAAKDPAAPDRFVAALFLPGQLLVVAASYSAPVLLDERLGKREYREVYIDLQSASKPDSRVFVDDLGADGLAARPDENQPFDSVEASGKRMAYDGQWRKQKLSEDDYMKAFSGDDAQYAHMLQLLLAEAKKPRS